MSFPTLAVIILGAYALMAGLITLAGWYLQVPRLTDWLGTGIPMFANTAVAASCMAAGLLVGLLKTRLASVASLILGFGVALIGGLTLYQHLFGIDLGIDRLLVKNPWGDRAAVAPGRMGPPASLSYLLLGTAQMLIPLRLSSRRFVPAIGILVTVISMLGLTGYAFQADPLFSVAKLTGIAMPTATILLALGLAVVGSVPDLEPVRTLREDSAAGLLTRWALPFVIALPIALGWLFVHGRAGGWFDRGLGIAILILALITLLCTLLWWCTAAVAAHEKISRASEARFRSYFELGLIGMAVTSPTKGMIEVNDEMCKVLGYDRRELLQLTWPQLTCPEDLSAELAQFNRVLAGETDGYSLEKKFVRKDGEIVPATISVRCVRRPDGAPDYFVAMVQDITNRKQAEEVLREQTRSLEIINGVGNILAGELDLEKLIQSVTDAGREITGARFGAFFYNARNDTKDGYTLYTLSGVSRLAFSKFPLPRNTELFNPAFNGKSVVRIADVLQDSRYGTNPPPHETSEGHLLLRSYLAVPVVSRSGEVLGGLFYGHPQPGVFTEENEKIITAISAQAAVAIDNAHLYRKAQLEIVERRRAAEVKGRLAAIVEHSDDAIIGLDLEGLIRSWNLGAQRMFGYSAQEVVDKSITLLIPPDRVQEETTILEGIRKGDATVHYETVRRRKDGTLLDVSLTASPVRDESGAIIGASKISRDITERKRTDRQQLALYELVATINRTSVMPDIFDAAIEATCRCQAANRASILLTDPDGVMRFKAWRGLSESYRRAVEGHSPWKPDDPDPQLVWIDDVNQVELDEHLRSVIVSEGIRALAFIPLKCEKGLLGKFMVYYDAPHHFTAEELRPAQAIASQVVFAIERRRSGEALEQLVSERTVSLRDAIAQMEEFSYTVSHDLRAPLRGMKAYTDILLEDFASKLPAPALNYLNRIAVNANRLDKMILDVLTFSRLGRAEFKLERVATDKLVRQIVEQYPGLQAPQAQIEIEELPDVVGHEPSLTQALSNLLNNAVKFVPPNVTPKVRVRSEKANGHVRVWVEDNGIGIDPKYQQRLFNMFERIHPNSKYEGTGVGLAIVRKAVERMGGRVGMESDGAHGSRFWIEVRAAN